MLSIISNQFTKFKSGCSRLAYFAWILTPVCMYVDAVRVLQVCLRLPHVGCWYRHGIGGMYVDVLIHHIFCHLHYLFSDAWISIWTLWQRGRHTYWQIYICIWTAIQTLCIYRRLMYCSDGYMNSSMQHLSQIAWLHTVNNGNWPIFWSNTLQNKMHLVRTMQ